MASIEHTFERTADSRRDMSSTNGRSGMPSSSSKDFSSARQTVWRELSVIREAARGSQPVDKKPSKEAVDLRAGRTDASDK